MSWPDESSGAPSLVIHAGKVAPLPRPLPAMTTNTFFFKTLFRQEYPTNLQNPSNNIKQLIEPNQEILKIKTTNTEGSERRLIFIQSNLSLL